MNSLLVCLSYGRNNEAVLHPILKERLELVRNLYEINKSEIVLLGGSNYQIEDNNNAPIGMVMGNYLKHYVPSSDIATIKRAGDSTIEQLCYLREYVHQINFSGKIIIIASKYFTERVLLYSDYIFDSSNITVDIRAADVPNKYKLRFCLIEKYKYFTSKKWLKQFDKGDYLKILKEQKIFQNKVKNGKAWSPLS